MWSASRLSSATQHRLRTEEHERKGGAAGVLMGGGVGGKGNAESMKVDLRLGQNELLCCWATSLEACEASWERC